MTSILQIRGMDESDLEILRQRAEDEGVSLSAYVRRVLHREAGQRSKSEVLRQIAEDEPVDFPPEKIPELIQSERPA